MGVKWIKDGLTQHVAMRSLGGRSADLIIRERQINNSYGSGSEDLLASLDFAVGHPEVTTVWSSNLCPRRPPMADLKAFALRWAKINGFSPIPPSKTA